MTWEKKGTEWPDDCAEAGLSDAAYRTHDEGTNYVYRAERMDCKIKKSTMRRWAGSDRPEAAITELINAGFWIDHGTDWEILHHADVIRQSIAAQVKHREKEKDRQRRKRAGVGDPVDSNVGADVGTNVGETQSDRQTDSSKGEHVETEVINEQTGEVFSIPAVVANPKVCRGCGLPFTAMNRDCSDPVHAAKRDWGVA